LGHMTQTTDHSTLWGHGTPCMIDNRAVAHSRTLSFFESL